MRLLVVTRDSAVTPGDVWLVLTDLVAVKRSVAEADWYSSWLSDGRVPGLGTVRHGSGDDPALIRSDLSSPRDQLGFVAHSRIEERERDSFLGYQRHVHTTSTTVITRTDCRS